MTESASNGPQVALFVTCLTDQFYPRVGLAVTKVLEHLGCRVVFPKEQTCCGQPFYNNGLHRQARDLAKRHVEIFESYEYTVTPSASCCAMVRKHFQELLEGNAAWEPGVRRVAAKTFEFAEFLDRVLKVDLTKFSLPEALDFTYHPTCHLRDLNAWESSPRLLKQIGNARSTPLDRAEECCGFGGAFSVQYPDISKAIVEDKADCIAKTGVKTLVCNDAGCTMNISGLCHRKGMDIRVRHLAEILAVAMGLNLNSW